MFKLILILLLAITGNVMADQYPENFDAISTKIETVGYDNLSEQEKLIYCIWWLEGEVNNGGFHQFFSNSSGDYTNEILGFLITIQANHTAELLSQASMVAFGGHAPADQDIRVQLLEKNEEANIEKLNLLSTEFYKYKDDIAGLVNKYLNK